jgi:hypothetical protein
MGPKIAEGVSRHEEEPSRLSLSFIVDEVGAEQRDGTHGLGLALIGVQRVEPADHRVAFGAPENPRFGTQEDLRCSEVVGLW